MFINRLLPFKFEGNIKFVVKLISQDFTAFKLI